MAFLGVKWGSMGSMWFAEVQSGSQGLFEVHLGSVRFNEVQYFLGGYMGFYGFNVGRWCSMLFAGIFLGSMGFYGFSVVR